MLATQRQAHCRASPLQQLQQSPAAMRVTCRLPVFPPRALRGRYFWVGSSGGSGAAGLVVGPTLMQCLLLSISLGDLSVKTVVWCCLCVELLSLSDACVCGPPKLLERAFEGRMHQACRVVFLHTMPAVLCVCHSCLLTALRLCSSRSGVALGMKLAAACSSSRDCCWGLVYEHVLVEAGRWGCCCGVFS